MDVRLEQNLTLAELIDAEALRNLCLSFGNLCQTDIYVLGIDGTPLFGDADSRRTCPGGNGHAHCEFCHGDATPLDDRLAKIAQVSCRQDVRYLRARVHNQFDPIGYILIGPFADGLEGVDFGAPLDTSAGVLDGSQIHRAAASAEFLCTVIEEIVLADYRAYLASKMSLQSRADSALIGKDNELQDYEDTLEQSKELHSLF